ncbi:hypothetical protein B484DRAFT_276235, partial [Ochromonadaceae sp. CCMP2298]
MERYGMIDDEDNTEEIANGMINIPATEKTYETVIRKIRGFVGVPVNETIPSDLLTDHTFSNFLLKLGKEHEWKPHFRKVAQAAIRALLKKAGIPLLFDRMDLWTATHRVLARWACELKITPYHKEGSTPYSAEVLGMILKLICSTPEEIRDHAVVLLTCFTSLRIEDVDFMKERNITL